MQRLGMNGIAFYRRTSAVSTPVKYARDTPFSTVKVAAMQRVFFAASDRVPTHLRVVRNRHFKTYDSILLDLETYAGSTPSNSTVQAAVTNPKSVSYAQIDLFYRPQAFYFARAAGSWPDPVCCF